MLNQIKQESKVRVQNITADGNLKVTLPLTLPLTLTLTLALILALTLTLTLTKPNPPPPPHPHLNPTPTPTPNPTPDQVTQLNQEKDQKLTQLRSEAQVRSRLLARSK